MIKRKKPHTKIRNSTVVWIKYTSAVLISIAMVLHVIGATPWNSIIQLAGAAGWVYVGYQWKERALILNFLPQFFIIIPMLIWIYWIAQ